MVKIISRELVDLHGEMIRVEDLTEIQLAEVICNNQDYIYDLDVSILKGRGTAKILSAHPNLIEELDINTMLGDDISETLQERPSLINELSTLLDRMGAWNILEVLRRQPQLIGNLQYLHLPKTHKIEMCNYIPELKNQLDI